MASRKDKTIADLAIANQTLLERLKAGMIRDYEAVFPEIEKAITATLAATKVDTLDELTAKELDATLQELRQAQLQHYGKANGQLLDSLERTGRFVIGKDAADLDRLAREASVEGFQWDIPKPAASWAYTLAQPVQATGELLKPFIAKVSTSNVAAVESAVRNGWAQGKTIGAVTREIFGTKKNNYKDGLTDMKFRRNVEAMVRTSTQHVAGQSRMAFLQENDDLVTGYTFIATLDSRTSAQCRSLDGRIFQLGKGPMPPVHVNCRSTIIPKLGPEFDFLEEGATRSSADGYVSADTTYYDWLKGKPQAEVEEILGKTRAQLFKSGGLTADEFARYNVGRNFEPLTLEELYIKDPEPFQKAGVKPPGVQNPDDLELFAAGRASGERAVSIPVSDGLTGAGVLPTGDLAERIQASPEFAKRVKYSDLLATQETVSQETVQFYLKNGVDTRGIFAIREGGQLHVIDGHHRLEAELLKGNKSGIITVIDGDNPLLARITSKGVFPKTIPDLVTPGYEFSNLPQGFTVKNKVLVSPNGTELGTVSKGKFGSLDALNNWVTEQRKLGEPHAQSSWRSLFEYTDVFAPRPGTKRAAAFDLLSDMKSTLGRNPTLEEALKEAKIRGVEPGKVRGQFQGWVDETSGASQIPPPPAPSPVAPVMPTITNPTPVQVSIPGTAKADLEDRLMRVIEKAPYQRPEWFQMVARAKDMEAQLAALVDEIEDLDATTAGRVNPRMAQARAEYTDLSKKHTALLKDSIGSNAVLRDAFRKELFGEFAEANKDFKFRMNLADVPTTFKPNINKALSTLRGILHPDVLKIMDDGVSYVDWSTAKDLRESYRKVYRSINIGQGTTQRVLLHELVHSLEQDMEIRAATNRFLESRAKRVEAKFPKPFKEMKGGYKSDETGYEDEWFTKGGHPYTGRNYPGVSPFTEILSTAIERLDSDPVGFYLRDPEYFMFVISIFKKL